MQLGGKHEVGIHRLRFLYPEFGQMRLDVSVERGVDLHHVKAAGQNLERMLLPVLHSWRIEDSFPVLVGPAGSAYPDLGGCAQDDAFGELDACRLAQASGGVLKAEVRSKRHPEGLQS